MKFLTHHLKSLLSKDSSITSDHNRTVYQELAEHLSGDSLTYFHASEHVVYLLIACIIIIATFFDCAFICGSDGVNGVLVALSQCVLILQKQGWGAPAWPLLSHLLLLDMLELMMKWTNHETF